MKSNKRSTAVNKNSSDQKEKWSLLDKISNLLLEATKNRLSMEV